MSEEVRNLDPVSRLAFLFRIPIPQRLIEAENTSVFDAVTALSKHSGGYTSYLGWGAESGSPPEEIMVFEFYGPQASSVAARNDRHTSLNNLIAAMKSQGESRVMVMGPDYANIY